MEEHLESLSVADLFELRNRLRGMRILGPWTERTDLDGSVWWVRCASDAPTCGPTGWVAREVVGEGYEGHVQGTLDGIWEDTASAARDRVDAVLRREGWRLA